jgi:hypothetical protein
MFIIAPLYYRTSTLYERLHYITRQLGRPQSHVGRPCPRHPEEPYQNGSPLPPTQCHEVDHHKRVPIAGQAVDRPTETQLQFSATFIDDTIQYQMAQIKNACLPGIAPITSATLQLANIQQK